MEVDEEGWVWLDKSIHLNKFKNLDKSDAQFILNNINIINIGFCVAVKESFIKQHINDPFIRSVKRGLIPFDEEKFLAEVKDFDSLAKYFAIKAPL
jgi:hypothetical protein